MDFLDPAQTVTCSVTLDDTHRDAGTLESARGSHLWPLTPLQEAFHGQHDYRSQMKAAAAAAGVEPPEPTFIEVPAGSCVFHAGEIWHGSGPTRLAIVCAARSASTWCQVTRSSAIDRAATSIGATSELTILRSTRVFSRCFGPKAGSARPGSTAIAKLASVGTLRG